MEARPKTQRKADVLARLAAPVLDAWVASADGDPYLVPLTLAWHEERLLLATGRGTPTVRNITARGRARVAIGPTRDVVMIDALLSLEVPAAGSSEAAAYAAQNDWDPGTAGPGYVILVLRPDRIQAWREENELPDRLLMKNGVWLV
jgi:general stress protein 26